MTSHAFLDNSTRFDQSKLALLLRSFRCLKMALNAV